MQKTKTKIMTLLLLTTMTLALFPLVNASTGTIFINPASTTTPISALNQHYAAGSPVNLFFGGVAFSGGQFVLYLSTNGFSDLVTRNGQPDIPYSATFDTVNLTDTVATHVYTLAGGFTWTIGSNWINGTLPRMIAGGSYFIKAFDGTQTSVAVTDTSLFVDPSVSIAPTSGNAGTSITFSGNAFQLGALLNLSYAIGANPIVYFQNLTTVGSIGNFSVTMPAPDAKQALAAGLTAQGNTTISFAAAINGTTTVVGATVPFTEFARGLVQIKVTSPTSEQLATTGNVFGNLTSFEIGGALPVNGIGVNKVVRLAGNNFYAGNASIRWDNAVTLGTVIVNATGWFNTTVTVPIAANGQHNITIVDANNVAFQVAITVVPSITLNPTSGPSGITVTVTGYGFPATTTGNVDLATVSWLVPATNFTSVVVDATGTFTATFVVPNAPGGTNTVLAASNSTGANVTLATATFTITGVFAVIPSAFNNSASQLVTATGTGFSPLSSYTVEIDNVFNYLSGISVTPDVNGTLKFGFIGDGFRAGEHVVVLYAVGGNNFPVANATFTVASDASSDLLLAVNKTIGNIHDDLLTDYTSLQTSLASVNAAVTTINGNTASLSSSIGSLTTSVSSISSSLSSVTSSLATVTTSLGTVTTTLNSISASITSVSGDTATIKSTVGTISTSLSSIGATVTTIQGNVATVQTSLGTLSGTVTSISGDTATIKTSLGTMQADISAIQTSVGGVQTSVNGVQSSVNGVQSSVGNVQTSLGTLQTDVSSTKSTSESLSPLIIVAIVLALIAAIAAIASIVLMRRKIAG